jgi:hypothetical protein
VRFRSAALKEGSTIDALRWTMQLPGGLGGVADWRSSLARGLRDRRQNLAAYQDEGDQGNPIIIAGFAAALLARRWIKAAADGALIDALSSQRIQAIPGQASVKRDTHHHGPAARGGWDLRPIAEAGWTAFLVTNPILPAARLLREPCATEPIARSR